MKETRFRKPLFLTNDTPQPNKNIRRQTSSNTTLIIRFFRLFRGGRTAHNGLVGGSSPPGPPPHFTYGRANEDRDGPGIFSESFRRTVASLRSSVTRGNADKRCYFIDSLVASSRTLVSTSDAVGTVFGITPALTNSSCIQSIRSAGIANAGSI